jgi:hypothetical protein
MATALSTTSVEDLRSIKLPEPEGSLGSSAFGDRTVKKIELKRGWITVDEYARKSQNQVDDVERSAMAGRFGPVGTDAITGSKLLFWPPEEHAKALSELPPFDANKTYVVTVAERRRRVSLEIDSGQPDAQRVFLRLASSHGNPEEASEAVLELLREVCFIQEWSAFEIFIKETVHDLLRKHPAKLGSAARGKKTAFGADDLLEMSNNLQSIETLAERIVQREIERQQSDGQSVHGMINFLKNEFRFADDPYCAPYLFRGVRTKTHFNDLMELKEVRNSLIHDGGIPLESLFHTWPSIPQKNGRVLVSKEYDERALLILRSVAGKIAGSIARGKYTVG